MRPWIFLVIAGLLEILWAFSMKFTHGFTRLWPSLGTASAMIASFYFLSRALEKIPVGTAYAIWTGIGAAGVAILGMIFLGEPRNLSRIFFILLILLGVAGLKASTN